MTCFNTTRRLKTNVLFFIDPIVAQNNSGVEHAAFNRLKLFKDHGQEAKLVTRNYNRFLYKFLKDEGVPAEQSISMFDFFFSTPSVMSVNHFIPMI